VSEPKSYLAEEERQQALALSTQGSDERDALNVLYTYESMAAYNAGDEAAAGAWILKTELPAYRLMAIKKSRGADYIRERGYLTRKADEAYGPDWLDQ
jgi:hypothetical protein